MSDSLIAVILFLIAAYMQHRPRTTINKPLKSQAVSRDGWVDTSHAMHMQFPRLRNVWGHAADILVLCTKHARLLIGQWIRHATKLFKLLAWRIIALYKHDLHK